MKKIRIILCILTLICVSIVSNKVKADELVDDGAEITSAQIIQTKTGTGPWDDDDEPGNDSSEDNDIVRSFDKVTWTIENTMGINGTDADSYTGGRIYFEAKLPDTTISSKDIAWDVESMGWIENATLSEDKHTLTGYYQLGSSAITVPGKQTLLFVTNVYGAKNGTEFTPEFTFWMNGNSDDDKVTVKSKKITVSSKGKYNIRLYKGDNNINTEIDINGEKKEGKVYNYCLLFQMYNTDSAKGKKGIAYPEGDITFDLNMQLNRTDLATKVTQDISDKTNLLLYNYCKYGDSTRAITDRKNIDMGGGIYWQVPGSNRYSNKNVTNDLIDRYIYKSGNIEMVQEGNVIHVTLKDYDFDGNFPIKSQEPTNNTIFFSDNIANVSKIYFQTFIMNNEETTKENSSYYFKVSEDNMKVKSNSQEEITTQEKTNDDAINSQYVAYSKGNYWNDYYFDGTNFNILHSRWDKGDGVAYVGQKILGEIAFYQSSNNTLDSHTIKSINALYKFDNNAYKISTLNDKKYFISNEKYCNGNFYYAAKPDGTGWTDIKEQNTAKFEDLVYYNSLEELEADGKICVGALFETTECNWSLSTVGTNIRLRIPLEVINTAEVGKTYQECGQVQMFTTQLDRTKESMVVDGGAYTTTPVFQNVSNSYIKTEYDENGVQKSGTHVSVKTGNSLLIVGAKSVIKNEIVNTNNDGTTKTSYDMGRSEYNVTYKISPSLNKISSTQSTTKTTIKITDVLPSGLTYVANSCSFGEPEITKNSDGSTSLVWYIYDAEVGASIDPFTFTAHINEESVNDTQYTTIATIYAGDIDKSTEDNRKSSNTISIVNLASHRLYKSVVTPVIEKNGEVHFVTSYKNNTDSEIPAFQLLDILPYNEDNRGTAFNGTYTLDKVVITQQDSDGNDITNDSMKLYYSDDEESRKANSKDKDLAQGWTQITSENISHSAKAVALIGKVLPQEKINVDIYLKTEGNKGLDRYVNSASAQVYESTEEMVTANVTSQVISRTLEGIAWIDKNGNGLKDDDEEVAKGITLTLTDETGAQVIDASGKVVTSVKTDENGYYKFTDLPSKKYIVSTTIPDKTYTITEKEVGTNTTINSKFNESTKATDEIEKLNSVDLPVLTVSNVNVGFVKKPTKVIVNYKEKDTDTKLLDEETIDGRIDDSYETTNKLDEVNEKYNNKYKYTSVDGNETGTMTEDTIYITYYYEKVYGSLKITKVDKNNNETKIKGATYKLENDEGYSKELTTDENGEVLFDSLEIGKYTLKETQAPSGYELEGKSKEIEIIQANKDVEVIASDRLRIVLPDTGKINYTVLIILSGIVIVSIGIILKNKKKLKVEKINNK